MTIDQFPENHLSAAAVTTFIALFAVVFFLRAFHTSTHHDYTETTADSAARSADVSAGMFCVAAAPLLFITPVVSAFMTVCAAAMIGYGLWLENRPREAPAAVRLARQDLDDGVARTSAGIIHQHRTTPAEFHRHRNQRDPR